MHSNLLEDHATMLQRIAIAPGHRGPTVAITTQRVVQFRQQPCALLIEAFATSAERRRERRRAGAAIFGGVEHAIELVHVLCNESGITDDVTLAACVLHDNLRDTHMTYMDLRRQFGPVVAEVVAELADQNSGLLPDRPAVRLHASGSPSHRAKLITLAQQVVAMRDLAGGALARGEAGGVSTESLNAVVESLRGTHTTLECLFDEARARLQ
jgi:guanosine-3',5'-bis(diphosphate) 3'-pyrophosphohydrolase